MTRAILTLHRLNRLKRIADNASRAIREAQSDGDLPDLRSLLSLAQAHFDKISQFDLKILEHPELPGEEVGAEAQSYDEDRALGLQCISNLTACLQTSASPVTRAPSAETGVADPTVPTGQESQPLDGPNSVDPLLTCSGYNSNSVDVTPEPFDGNRLHYRSFMAQFNNWVSRKKRLTQIDKLIVLRKHLRGEAKVLIEPLEITSTNFDVGIDLQHQAFGQVNIERQQIMSTLFNLPRVGSCSDLTGLRNVLNFVQACMQRMETIGAPLTEYALALEPYLHKSIPSHLFFEYFECSSEASPSVTDTASSASSDRSSGAVTDFSSGSLRSARQAT